MLCASVGKKQVKLAAKWSITNLKYIIFIGSKVKLSIDSRKLNHYLYNRNINGRGLKV